MVQGGFNGWSRMAALLWNWGWIGRGAWLRVWFQLSWVELGSVLLLGRFRVSAGLGGGHGGVLGLGPSWCVRVCWCWVSYTWFKQGCYVGYRRLRIGKGIGIGIPFAFLSLGVGV